MSHKRNKDLTFLILDIVNFDYNDIICANEVKFHEKNRKSFKKSIEYGNRYS